jgi:5-carboxyvanillate decarboxylase
MNVVLSTGGQQGYLRIATEEAFAPPEMLELYRREVARNPADEPGFMSLWGFFIGSTDPYPSNVVARLQDLGERRLQDMDASGIDRQVIFLTAPGVQIFDAPTANSLAELSNDRLADAVHRHPDRFTGLAAVAPQDPPAAARELERAVRTLGLKGAVINSHTKGEYLDDPKFWVIFEAAEALGVPIYLHPRNPSPKMIEPMRECGLDSAIFGFGVETGLHTLRIITAGVFDRFPGLRLVIGHLGEALPFWLYRIDHMHGAAVRSGRHPRLKKLQKRTSDYLRENIWITSSGMAWEPAILFTQQVLGVDRVLYAMDYPYQFVPAEVAATDALPISGPDKRKLFQENAERVFGI